MNFVFEFDEAKSLANKAKHGIDFVEAQALWKDEELHVLLATQFDSELRWAAIGVVGGKHWTAIYTMSNNLIRVISMRRSREKEEDLYESQ